jgi:hypothetical protein
MFNMTSLYTAYPRGRAVLDMGLRPLAFGIASLKPAGDKDVCIL